MWVGTFHGLCHRMLRTHYQDAGLLQAFQILDSADQLALIKRILKELMADEKKFPPRQVQWFINNAKEAGLRAAYVTIEDAFHAACWSFIKRTSSNARRKARWILPNCCCAVMNC
jgi:DNA helicase-2/ATP-dependent DNA helicase PcrA